MANANASKPTAPKAARPTDAELTQAAHLIHGAPLRNVKVVGGHVEGTNARGQTVILAHKTILARMAAGEFTRPDAMPEPAEADADADQVEADAPETDPS